MNLDSIILWLETYAFRGFIMVAVASSLIGLFGLFLSLAFRRRSAAVRFSIWQMVACGVVLSTALILFVDGVAIGPVQKPMPMKFAIEQLQDMEPIRLTSERLDFDSEATQGPSVPFVNTTSSDGNEVKEPIPTVAETKKAYPLAPTPLPTISWAAIVGATWICVGLILSLGVAKSTIHAWSIVRRADLPDAERFSACLQAAMKRVGLKSDFNVRLVQTDRMSVPFTIGFMRPTVVVPKEANDWSTEKLTMVLAHELAHVKRRDVFWQWISRLACCVTGFNPLTWLAVRRCAIEREHACDDCVIDAGFDAADYGETLLEIASTISGKRVPLIGISMAQPALRQRLETVLANGTDRRPVARRTLIGLLTVFASLAITTGILRPLERRVLAEQPTTVQSVEAVTPVEEPETATLNDDRKDDINDKMFVTGSVSDLDARPIANATVVLHQREFTKAGPHYPETLVRSWTTVTDEQGNYRVSAGTPSDFSDKSRIGVAYAFADGFARKGGRDWKKLPEIRKGKSISPIKLQAGHLVRGRLLDSNGDPIKGMVKGAGTAGEINDMWWINVAPEVGDDGQIEVSVPDNYQIELMAYAAGHAPKRIVLTKDDTEIGDVKLLKGTIVKGVLIDKENKPVPNVVIAMQGTGGKLDGIGFEEDYAVLTRKDGKFEFPRSSGKFSVRATTESHASNYSSQTTITGDSPPAVLPISLNLEDEGESIELTLQESDSVTVAGVARWENGDPAANLTIQCSGWHKIDGQSAGGEFARTKTDAEGRYSVTVPASLDSVNLLAPGTKNPEGIWLPAYGECEAATYADSQQMEFESLNRDITTANWVLKPWPDRKIKSKLQRKAEKELKAIIAKEEALSEEHRKNRTNTSAARAIQFDPNAKKGEQDFDEDPYALHPRIKMVHEYLAFERENRGDESALKALKIVMQTANSFNYPDGVAARARNEAVDRLIRHYATHKDLASTLHYLDNESTVPRGTRLLTKALQENRHSSVQAESLYVQATRIKDMIRDIEMLPQLIRKSESRIMYRGQRKALVARIEQLRNANIDKLRQTGNKLLDRLTSEFGDTDFNRWRSTFGEHAAKLRFAINNVQAGATVPEMDIMDINGKPFRFADHKGKYIVLTFCSLGNHSHFQSKFQKLKDALPDVPLHFVTVCGGNPDTEITDRPNRDIGTIIREGYWGKMAISWGLAGFGYMFVIDKDGTLQPQLLTPFSPQETAANVIRGLENGE